MPLILNIDTSIQSGSVCLNRNGESIGYLENNNQGQQAGWLHGAIKQLAEDCGITLKSLDAIAVSNGPGSYTGLRISLSAAKGICYALNIPLILVSTLKVMAVAVAPQADDLICPMIDARRMEVFTALYDRGLNLVEEPRALILQENSFSEILASHRVLFTGNGSEKFKNLAHSSNASFVEHQPNAHDLSYLSSKMYEESLFTDLAYSEPEYVKAAHTT